MVPKPAMNNTNQMNGLYPIVRRVRRPLLPIEQPADAKPREPVRPEEKQRADDSVVVPLGQEAEPVHVSDERS